jgi:DNA modification methylase
MFSFVDDVVLDPFAGTGTTAIAALETGRNSVSLDVDEGYVNLIEGRLMTHEQPSAVELQRPAVVHIESARSVDCAAAIGLA